MSSKPAFPLCPKPPRALGYAFASGIAIAAVYAGPIESVAAQSSPNSFQLPTPTPTPTAAPQGPVDVRAGVPIGPRSIPDRNAAPPPSPPPARSSATPTPTPTPTTRPGTPPATGAGSQLPPSSAPSSTLPLPNRPVTEPGPTSSRPPGSDAATPPPPPPNTAPETIGSASGLDDLQTDESPAETDGQGVVTDNWLWLAGLLAILAIIAGVIFWRGKRAGAVKRAPHRAASGVDLADTAAGVDGAATVPLDQRLNIELDIVSATRSFMMFTLEYRITMANRSDRAVRDLSLSAQLVCAERGAGNAPNGTTGQIVGTIERIGPHQSRSLSGQMQMPLTEVRAIQQGGKPLFIPLLHVSLAVDGKPELQRSFVVGTPSAASQGKLHPLPLDTPPGGLPGLKAREISLSAA